MRILIVAPMLPQAEGAGAIPVLLHAELTGLREQHEVTFVAGVGDEPGEAEALAALTDAGVDVHVVDRRVPATASRRLRRRAQLVARWSRGSWPWRTVWFAAPGLQRVVDGLLAARRYDVVAIEDNAMAVVRLPRDMPAVLTELEVRRPQPRAAAPAAARDWPAWVVGELDRGRWVRFETAMWRRYDRVVVYSEGDARAVGELAPDVAARVVVSPFGIVLPPAADPARVAAGLILFVGAFHHGPNRDAATWLAREILPRVRASAPDARLRIVGAVPPPEVLELAGPHVEVVPDAPEVQPHLEAAAVVVAPVREGGGMRMKVLHAMAVGKAVVTTPLGSEGLDHGEGAAPPLALADDAEGIAAAIVGLLVDEPARLDLGRRARAHAEAHHSPQAWASRLTAIYEDAALRRAGARP